MADLEGILGATPHAPLGDGRVGYIEPSLQSPRPRGRPKGSTSGPRGLPYHSVIDPLTLVNDPDLELAIQEVLMGLVPRARELRPWEPKKLTARHISVIFMRAAGLAQNEIGRMTGYKDSQISIILGHPDAQFLLVKLLSKTGTTAATDMKARLEAGVPRMLDIVEEIATDDENKADVRLRAAFGWIDRGGYTPTQKVETNQKVHVVVEGSHAELLSTAIREAGEIQEADYVIVGGAQEGSADPAADDIQPPVSTANLERSVEVLPQLPPTRSTAQEAAMPGNATPLPKEEVA